MTSAVAPAFRSRYCALPRDGRVVSRPCGFVVDEERQMGRVEALAAVCHERGEAPGMHALAQQPFIGFRIGGWCVHAQPLRRACAASARCRRSLTGDIRHGNGFQEAVHRPLVDLGLDIDALGL